MPLPLGADDDVCLVGAHRLLPFCVVDLHIRFVLTAPFSFILFSFDCGSGIREAVLPHHIAFSLFSFCGIIFDNAHVMRFNDLTLFHSELR